MAVVFKGGGDIHSYLQRWAALHISIQSNDPGRIAIEDRDADVRILSEFIIRDGNEVESAERYYDQWREGREWAIFEYELDDIDMDPSGDSAVVKQTLKMRYAPLHADPMALRLERTEEQRSTWNRIDGRWYLSELNLVELETVERPVRAVIRPEDANPDEDQQEIANPR